MLTLRPLKNAAGPCACASETWAPKNDETKNGAIETFKNAPTASAVPRGRLPPSISILLAAMPPARRGGIPLHERRERKCAAKSKTPHARCRRPAIGGSNRSVGSEAGCVLELNEPIESHFLDHAVAHDDEPG